MSTTETNDVVASIMRDVYERISNYVNECETKHGKRCDVVSFQLSDVSASMTVLLTFDTFDEVKEFKLVE